jgi:hypothetical protein
MDTERENLRHLLGSVEKKAFAEKIKLPGGASMLSQHLSGNRPISLEAAICYATGFGVSLEQISPRLAEKVLAVTAKLSMPVDPLTFHFAARRDASEPMSNNVVRENSAPVYRSDPAGSATPPDLSAALEILGIALALPMPNDVRDDVADALHKMASRKGAERDQKQVLALLETTYGKQQTGT